jgi:hypothetical protein
MTLDNHIHNPYRPPTVLEPSHREELDSLIPYRRFRWRVIGVTMLYLYGSALVIISTLSAIHTCVWFAVFLRRGEHIRFSWVASVTMSAAVAMLLGLIFLFAGRSFWKSRWKIGLLAVSAAAILYMAFDAVGGRIIGIN